MSTTSPAGLAGSTHARRSSPLYPSLLPAFAIAAILGLRKQGRRRWWLGSGLFIVTLALTLSGCGGKGTPPVTKTFTPPGTYIITVTGTNTTTNSQSSTTLTLTVL